MRSSFPSALTFDDGPAEKLTLELLDVLEEAKVFATFFCVGRRAKKHSSIVSEISKRGHEVGNHSWSHSNFLTLSDQELQIEVTKAQDCLAEMLGTPPKLLRPPFGLITAHQRALCRQWCGCDTVGWNVDTQDWKLPGIDSVCSTIIAAQNTGNVLLLHDTRAQTVAAVSKALAGIVEPERHFVTVSKLRAMFAASGEMDAKRGLVQNSDKASPLSPLFPRGRGA